MKLALNMIVRPADDEAEALARCLNSVAEHVDGIFITITGHNEKCERVANMYGAHISHFEWCDDFAKARNFALDQIPDEYTHWMWLDCDDVLLGAEELKDTIEQSNNADVIAMRYNYFYNEQGEPEVVHIKTRIAKNDGCVRWVGKLHEDFKESRELVSILAKNIEVAHMTNGERTHTSMLRNLQIAKKAFDEAPDDPRSYWLLANAYKAANQDKDASEAFEEFLKVSKSDEEKFIANMRLSEINRHMGMIEKAIK